MKAPICRICGHAHWGSDHAFPAGVVKREPEQNQKPPLKSAKPEAVKVKPAVRSPAKSKPVAKKPAKVAVKKPAKRKPAAARPERNVGGRPRKDAPPKSPADVAQREAELKAYRREYMRQYRLKQKG
jgi:hypothetical protein